MCILNIIINPRENNFFKKCIKISKAQVIDFKNIVKKDKVLKVIDFSNSILSNFSGFTIQGGRMSCGL